MAALKIKITSKLQELHQQKDMEATQEKQVRITGQVKKKTAEEEFYEYIESVIFEDIMTLCKDSRESEVLHYYSYQITLLPADALILRKGTWLLFPAEIERLPAIYAMLRSVAKNVVSDLKACCESSRPLQYQIVGAEGHTLLHHALERLKRCKTPEQRQFIMSFITELYAHGALPFEYAHSEKSVIERSNIFKVPYINSHKLECWQLLLLRLEYTSCFSEAESQAKEALWAYGSQIPELLTANKIYQLYKDWHGLKRGSRFADVYALVNALDASSENLNDAHLTDQIQMSRSREGARGNDSDLFRSMNKVKTGIENGSVISAKQVGESKGANVEEVLHKNRKAGLESRSESRSESRRMFEEQRRINAVLCSYLSLVVSSSVKRRHRQSLPVEEKSSSSLVAPLTEVQTSAERSSVDVSALLQFSLLQQTGQDQTLVSSQVVENLSVSQQVTSAVNQPVTTSSVAQTLATTETVASSKKMEK